MRPSRLRIAAVLLAAAGAFGCVAPGAALRPATKGLGRLALGHGERLLVMVPHPDDEALCCAGMIARVLADGGSVHLVYATHGDGYRESVAAEMHESSPGPEAFVAYGERRRRESLAVLRQLRVPPGNARFLGFPDGGLRALWDHRFDDARPYRSRTTAAQAPPYADSPARGRVYTAAHLEAELARAIADTAPTLLVIPDARDQHGDHNALGLLCLEALAVAPPPREATPRILSYLVHWRTWPDTAPDPGAPLEPPAELESASLGWRVLPLSPAVATEKRRLLHLYTTQMNAMGTFLERFPRRNELFAEVAGPPPRLAWYRHSSAPAAP